MKIPRIAGVLFLFSMFFPAFFALEAQEGSFAPYVTNISAKIEAGMVRISWIDSTDAAGPVYVYRSGAPFDEINPITISETELEPVEVSYGVQSYEEELPGFDPVYYLVVASDEEGQRYGVLEPSNNFIVLSPSGQEEDPVQDAGENVLADEPGQDAGQDAAPEYEEERVYVLEGGGTEEEEIMQDLFLEPKVREGIFRISATVQGEGIVISFETEESKNAVLYRSAGRILKAGDLENAVVVDPHVEPPFTDFPLPGTAYYYAVVFQEDLSDGKAVIEPGQNATTRAVGISAVVSRREGGGGEKPGIRSLPLPLLSVKTAVPQGNAFQDTPRTSDLGIDMSSFLSEMKVEKKPVPPREARVFGEDMIQNSGGESSELYFIVQGNMIQRNWDAAREELKHFLSLPRSMSVESRARYYLGQACYFTGRLGDALFEFLAVQDTFPEECANWIQATLDAMVEKR